MSKSIRVILADDHALVLDGLKQHLADTDDIEVVAQLAEGKTNQEIAALLYLSENTVKYYLKNIYQKLQVNNRTEAARIYLDRKGRGA